MSKKSEKKVFNFSSAAKGVMQKIREYSEPNSSTRFTAPNRVASQWTQPFWRRETTSPEGTFYRAYGFFWVIIFAFIFVFITVTIALSNPKFWFVAVLSLLALPFVVFYSIVQMIPRITIFGWTIFDRSYLTVRQQLSAGSRILRIFSRSFIQETPVAALFIFSFLILMAFGIIFALIA